MVMVEWKKGRRNGVLDVKQPIETVDLQIAIACSIRTCPTTLLSQCGYDCSDGTMQSSLCLIQSVTGTQRNDGPDGLLTIFSQVVSYDTNHWF